MTPPNEDPSQGQHGNGRLYAGLWPAGVILEDRCFIEPDGSLRMKLPWWRAPGVGRAGDLVITGHELGTGAPITSSIPDGYGQRFQARGIRFPTEGCYEIDGRSGGRPLRFVGVVMKVTDDKAAVAL